MEVVDSETTGFWTGLWLAERVGECCNGDSDKNYSGLQAGLERENQCQSYSGWLSLDLLMATWNTSMCLVFPEYIVLCCWRSQAGFMSRGIRSINDSGRQAGSILEWPLIHLTWLKRAIKIRVIKYTVFSLRWRAVLVTGRLFYLWYSGKALDEVQWDSPSLSDVWIILWCWL